MVDSQVIGMIKLGVFFGGPLLVLAWQRWAQKGQERRKRAAADRGA